MSTSKKQPEYIDFSQRLRQSAKKSRVSQKTIALRLRANPKTVKEWFDGVRLPRDKKIDLLASIVNHERDWLLNGDAKDTDSGESDSNALLEVSDSQHENDSKPCPAPEDLLETKIDNTGDNKSVGKSRTKISANEKIEKIEVKIKQLKKKIKDREDAAKIVVGEMVVNLAEKDTAVAKFLLDTLDEHVTKKSDKKKISGLLVNLRSIVESAK